MAAKIGSIVSSDGKRVLQLVNGDSTQIGSKIASTIAQNSGSALIKIDKITGKIKQVSQFTSLMIEAVNQVGKLTRNLSSLAMFSVSGGTGYVNGVANSGNGGKNSTAGSKSGSGGGSSGGNTTQTNGANAPKSMAMYNIIVDIGSVRLETAEGKDDITFYEKCDYLKENYPVRILTVKPTQPKIQNILNTKKTRYESFGELYDIDISVQSVGTSQYWQGKPFKDGKFKALLRTPDTDVSAKDTSDKKSNLYNTGASQNSNVRNELVFFLYREDELKNPAGANVGGIYENPKLTEVFQHNFQKANERSNTPVNLLVSKFDHNPNLGTLVKRPSSFLDNIKFLEKEVGFFKTKPMIFQENGVFFFLNTSNQVNALFDSMEVHIHLIPIMEGEQDVKSKGILKNDEHNYTISVSKSNIKQLNSNSSAFKDTVNYQTPSGVRGSNASDLTRNAKTITKVTEAAPILKLPNADYEYLEVTIDGYCVDFLSPLSIIEYTDSGANSITYRLASKEQMVVSGSINCTSKIVGFRLKSDEPLPKPNPLTVNATEIPPMGTSSGTNTNTEKTAQNKTMLTGTKTEAEIKKESKEVPEDTVSGDAGATAKKDTPSQSNGYIVWDNGEPRWVPFNETKKKEELALDKANPYSPINVIDAHEKIEKKNAEADAAEKNAAKSWATSSSSVGSSMKSTISADTNTVKQYDESDPSTW